MLFRIPDCGQRPKPQHPNFSCSSTEPTSSLPNLLLFHSHALTVPLPFPVTLTVEEAQSESHAAVEIRNHGGHVDKASSNNMKRSNNSNQSNPEFYGMCIHSKANSEYQGTQDASGNTCTPERIAALQTFLTALFYLDNVMQRDVEFTWRNWVKLG
jgi:hypothetical protein